MDTSKLPRARVAGRRDITDDLFILYLETPFEHSFRPGQYCTVALEGIARPYSIVSAPHEEQLELFIERIPEPEGKLTPLLHRLREGDELPIAPKIKGTFTLDTGKPNQVLIATVTGIAPFVSYLRDYVARGLEGHRFLAMLGGSYQQDLVYHDELSQLAAEHDFIDFLPTVSRPDEPANAGWQGETGRVNTLVDRYLDKFGFAPQDTILYACGNPQMIADVRGNFEPRGYDVREEKYW